MSGEMSPLSFRQLINWMDREASVQQSVFGIPFSTFYKPSRAQSFKLFGKSIDVLLGPAAGPHTQMAPNLIASYLAGGRFFELKTVQILDELQIDKPCINAQDECYNVEWSQELKLEQAFDEYLKAHILLTLLAKIITGADASDPGFIFNMSVGYNLEGVRHPRVDLFIRSLQDARLTPQFEQYIEECKTAVSNGAFSAIISSVHSTCTVEDLVTTLDNIPSCISDSITLSTMHGCPADEIESIATYLIIEKKLTTFVKLNPTLLGYTFVRETLDTLGFNYLEMDPHSFEKDISFEKAIPMVQRLLELAAEHGRLFGIKLSNTLGVKNDGKQLPGSEQYLSGRALFPLTINLARKITSAIKQDIHISYSGGITVHNIDDVLQTGIAPVTLATDLLKPGGYVRLHQLAQIAEKIASPAGLNRTLLEQIAADSLKNPVYHKSTREVVSIKVPASLPLTDCYMAPCSFACPVHQDVPEYIHLAAQGRYREAVDIIMDKNPLPHITSYICDHQCMFHCTRWDYDKPVEIRDIKKLSVTNGFDEFITDFRKTFSVRKNGINAAVIGAGPSGLAAAYYLALNGFSVTVFEKLAAPGGIVKNIIPQFRIPQEVIDKDIEFIASLGVTFVLNAPAEFSVQELKAKGYEYIYLAIGAEKANELALDQHEGIILDAIPFLWDYNHAVNRPLGKSVAVIGGGNSAMDAARAAKRSPGVERVFIIYRRTQEQMPADKEEFDSTIEDGVEFRDLLLPVSYSSTQLQCQKMALGEPGTDGRRSVYALQNEFETIEVDAVITAIGEHVNTNLLTLNNIAVKANGKPQLANSFNETSIPNVFIGGDASRGPSTVIQSAADGRIAAQEIVKRTGTEFQTAMQKVPALSISEMQQKAKSIKGDVILPFKDIANETSRCLSCNVICNKCTDVCPNRANVAIDVRGSLVSFKDTQQIVHIEDLCNECGNCETFCPYQGKPYKDKLTVFSGMHSFTESTNDGFYFNRTTRMVHFRVNKQTSQLPESQLPGIDGDLRQAAEIASAILHSHDYLM